MAAYILYFYSKKKRIVQKIEKICCEKRRTKVNVKVRRKKESPFLQQKVSGLSKNNKNTDYMSSRYTRNYTASTLDGQEDLLNSFLNSFHALSRKERKIWEVLHFLSNKFASVFPSHKKIAQLAFCSERTVRRAISKFKKSQWISVIKRAYKSCVYRIRKVLLSVDTRAKSPFLRTINREKKDELSNKTSLFILDFREKLSIKQKRIFLNLQGRSKYRFPFFSYQQLAKSCSCSVGTVIRFFKNYKDSLGFFRIRRGNLATSFSIFDELTYIDFKSEKTFLNHKNSFSKRSQQLLQTRELLKEFNFEAKEQTIIERYSPGCLRMAIEDYKSYKIRKKINKPIAFLISRCKDYSERKEHNPSLVCNPIHAVKRNEILKHKTKNKAIAEAAKQHCNTKELYAPKVSVSDLVVFIGDRSGVTRVEYADTNFIKKFYVALNRWNLSHVALNKKIP